MKDNMLKIAVSGAFGRMGRLLIKEIVNRNDLNITLAIIRDKTNLHNVNVKKMIGIDNIDFLIDDKLTNQNQLFDILIDFSNPISSIKYLKYCVKYSKGMIIGTTGFNNQEINYIKLAARETKIVQASNFSIGINLIYKLLKITTKLIGKDADIEIIESHHRNKIDAPSGTALEMGHIISNKMNLQLHTNAIYLRNGNVGIRPNKKIGFSSIRAGSITGEHTVMFATNTEEILITHKAINRISFVKGAIRAAIWLMTKKNGLFNMSDVLNI